MNQKAVFKASLQVEIVCQTTGAVVVVPEEFKCTTYPEQHTLDHPMILSTRIRQLAELRFLQHYIAGLVEDARDWQASWQIVIKDFSFI
jgi:hypothetical protein